ncbi:hypothetical protein HUJ05_011301 [Dendroctonus ponderosae]|nr:hypothetical protein HUJ05_011301 [Dendroctonus ponderosae]
MGFPPCPPWAAKFFNGRPPKLGVPAKKPPLIKREGGEEGSPEEGDDKAEGEEEAGSMTPTNSASPAPVEGSPPLDALSPGSLNDDPTLNREPSRCNSHESGDMLFPGGVALPPSMPALLPSQMAAYLNAAAHAVQSHRLMMTSPLPSGFGRAAVSPLISSTSSPPSCELSPNTEGILDFSRKRPEGAAASGAPLDLSVGSRKRAAEELLPQPPQRKAKPSVPAWPSYFMAGLSPKSPAPDLWNGKAKAAAPSEAAKALEKMSELSKIGGDDLFRMASGVPPSPSSNRNSAWQSHWLSKGAEQAKDVLKCVWCKQSFASLAALTTHMKEAKHCGTYIPVDWWAWLVGKLQRCQTFALFASATPPPLNSVSKACVPPSMGGPL